MDAAPKSGTLRYIEAFIWKALDMSAADGKPPAESLLDGVDSHTTL